MYVILTYDISSKRVSKVMKKCRKYLKHEQRSVFEGTITEGKLNNLKKELVDIIDTNEDSINFYAFSSLKYSAKEHIGKDGDFGNIL